jgi:hypothetical protein
VFGGDRGVGIAPDTQAILNGFLNLHFGRFLFALKIQGYPQITQIFADYSRFIREDESGHNKRCREALPFFTLKKPPGRIFEGFIYWCPGPESNRHTG